MTSPGQHHNMPDELPENPTGTSHRESEVIEFNPNAPYGGAGEGLEIVETAESVDTIPLNQDWFAAQEELEQRLGGLDHRVGHFRPLSIMA